MQLWLLVSNQESSTTMPTPAQEARALCCIYVRDE
jgi:hypothetical protein